MGSLPTRQLFLVQGRLGYLPELLIAVVEGYPSRIPFVLEQLEVIRSSEPENCMQFTSTHLCAVLPTGSHLVGMWLYMVV